jgi:hypothetical protein
MKIKKRFVKISRFMPALKPLSQSVFFSTFNNFQLLGELRVNVGDDGDKDNCG